MKTELYIARRFAFKARSMTRPTFIVMASVVGIAVGTAALILTLSIVSGFASIIEGKLIRFTSHLQVRQPDDRLFPETRYDLDRLKGTNGIVSASPFLEMNVMLRSRDAGGRYGAVVPAVIRGTPPDAASRFLGSGASAAKLVPSDSSAALPLMLGKSLAETMGVRAGDRIMIVGFGGKRGGALPDSRESVVELLSSLDLEVARVDGIYETGLNEGFDDVIVFADLNTLQQRYQPGMISGYEANVSDLRSLPSISSEVAGALGYPFFTYTVYERYANLFEWLKLQKNITPLLIVTITVVAVFNIVSTLLVLIIEKTREIGMLSALGLEPGRISVVFMAQAFMISLVGIVSGNLLALGLSLFEQRFHLITLPEKSYFIKHVPILINPADYLVVSCGVAVLTILFAFIPSRVAASLKPGTALTV
ncbi:MAG: FtsX-like permease family protein [Chlorobiales bacterium]|nr:FtsX-like permease family protein [Chlorobiales bacterium]